MTTRRSFLLGASSTALAGCLSSPSLRRADRDLRLSFGVLSDIHITDWASTEIFRKTLAYFRDQGVDAVMIAGDMADHGILPQLENVARAWYSVFPDDKAPDGRTVEKLFVYGNHDPDGLDYRDGAMRRTFEDMKMSYEEAEKVQIRTIGRAACWEKCFHEKYEPIYRKRVRGHDFIGAHWCNSRGVDGLEEWFAANGDSLPKDRPFFYFQHASPSSTVYGDDSWGDDDGRSSRALAAFPNAVAFSGHSHRSLTDLRSYWRGEFTSVGTSTLSYVCLPDGHRNTTDYRPRLDGRQGQVVRVYDDRLEFWRRDFYLDEDIDEPVVLPLPARSATFGVSGLSRAAMPAFPKGAQVKLTADDRHVAATFPGALANPTARPWDYKVHFEIRLKGEKRPKEADAGLWFHPDAIRARARLASHGTMVVKVDRSRFPANVEAVRVHVFARSSYCVVGDRLVTDWLPFSA